MSKGPCLAITLVNPRRPQEAGSYLWCKFDIHSGMHEDYSGLWWLCTGDQLVEVTPQMRTWREGNADDVRSVSGRLLG
jgi:hypothetical protein